MGRRPLPERIARAFGALVFFLAVILAAGLYVALISASLSSTIIFAFCAYLLLVACALAWLLCPRERRHAPPEPHVLVMPVYFTPRPRRLYRVLRLLLVLAVVTFCAANCLLCIFDVSLPYVSVVFVLAGVVTGCVYALVLQRERE